MHTSEVGSIGRREPALLGSHSHDHTTVAQPNPFLFLLHCVTVVYQPLPCTYSLSPFFLTAACCVLTPEGVHCCVFPPVYLTAPPTCLPAAVAHPPTHDPPPDSPLTGKMSSCSSPPCCRQYPLLPYFALSSPVCCCRRRCVVESPIRSVLSLRILCMCSNK